MGIDDLQELVRSALPGWIVTVDEADMVNVKSAGYDEDDLFAYIEEYYRSTADFSKYGRKATRTFDVYFAASCPIDADGAQRNGIRDAHLWPAARKVEELLRAKWNVTHFDYDLFPQGFDCGDCLVHVKFTWEGQEC